MTAGLFTTGVARSATGARLQMPSRRHQQKREAASGSGSVQWMCVACWLTLCSSDARALIHSAWDTRLLCALLSVKRVVLACPTCKRRESPWRRPRGSTEAIICAQLILMWLCTTACVSPQLSRNQRRARQLPGHEAACECYVGGATRQGSKSNGPVMWHRGRG